MDFSKLSNGFVKIYTWIFPSWYIDLSKLLHGFVKIVTWIWRSFSMFPRLLPNKTKVMLDQDFKACWSFYFEIKLLNESKYSMSWVRCAFGNVFACQQDQWSFFSMLPILRNISSLLSLNVLLTATQRLRILHCLPALPNRRKQSAEIRLF